MTGGLTGGLRVLIAPDCFGGTLTALQAAAAIAEGWRTARPHDVMVMMPLSDGGPGFVDALAARHGDWQVRRTRVRGPLSGDVDAAWVLDAEHATAYIESAAACGLALLGGPPTVATALEAHSFGVGQLIGEALRCGARTVIVGLGGSACTDGGRGMIEALGGPVEARRALAGVDVVVATDVEHPLLGPAGAARVFGPQKGADPHTVTVLEERLAQWATRLEAETGNSVSGLPGAGAAGGLGAALLALGGRRESGAALIAAHTGAQAAIDRADLVITGEGRLDQQSLRGKVVGSVAAAARRRGVPVVVLAGQITLSDSESAEAGISAAYAVSDHAGSVRRAVDDAAAQLSGLAARTASAWGPVERE